jgi:hypothetical protein
MNAAMCGGVFIRRCHAVRGDALGGVGQGGERLGEGHDSARRS